jgi:hypothetical protein
VAAFFDSGPGHSLWLKLLAKTEKVSGVAETFLRFKEIFR